MSKTMVFVIGAVLSPVVLAFADILIGLAGFLTLLWIGITYFQIVGEDQEDQDVNTRTRNGA
jgi:Sec-independent protein secretion pathway component TatC